MGILRCKGRAELEDVRSGAVSKAVHVWMAGIATPRQKAGMYAALGMLLALLGAFFLHQGSPVFPIDDAYISLHSAQALLTGKDIGFMGTPALAGVTSGIHVMLIAALIPFLGPTWALQAAIWLAICAYALGLLKLSFQWNASALQAALIVVLGMSIGLTPYQLTNGLETGLALAGITWILIAMNSRGAGFNWAFPLLCGQLPFIRPELMAASLLLIVAHASREANLRDGIRLAFLDLCVMLAGAAPWMALYYVNTGLPYPSTIEAKKWYFAEGCLPDGVKRQQVEDQLVAFARAIGFSAGAVVLLMATLPGRVALFFFVTFVSAYYINFPGALSHNEQRYLYIFVPFLVFGIISCIRHSFKPVRKLAQFLLIIGAWQAMLYLPTSFAVGERMRYFTKTERFALGAWLNGNLPANATLLIHDAGYISYGTNFRLVDLVGLKSPTSVPFHKHETWRTCGNGRGDAINDVALLARPDYLVVLSAWDSIFQITTSLLSHGWRLDPVRNFGAYKVYRLHPPVP